MKSNISRATGVVPLVAGCLALTLLLCAQPTNASAEQPTSTELTRGEIVGPIVTAQDETKTYFLYLPPEYTSDKKWPVIVVMDPRGRGRHAAEIFRSAAERFGYVLAGSNDTASDVPEGEESPNAAALAAVTDDLAQRFSLDGARLYLSGFSGTSRFAWAVGTSNPGQITGIIGCGGGLPGSQAKWRDPQFVYYGAAGVTDFNFAEMFELDRLLDKQGAPHRFTTFEGPHSWFPAEIATQAVAWLEIQAMRRGLRMPDPGLVAAIYAEEIDRAAALEERGALYEAARLYRAIARDYLDLHPTKDAMAAADRLESLDAVRDHDQRLSLAVRREQSFRSGLLKPFQALQAPNPPLSTARLRDDLKVTTLQRAAEGSGIESLSARRQLEIVAVHTSFYLPRQLMGQKQYAHVIPVLEIGTELRPQRADLWYNLACARALTGRRSQSLDALERAVAAGFTNLAHIEADPDLESLRKTRGYEQILKVLRAQAAEPKSP